MNLFKKKYIIMKIFRVNIDNSPGDWKSGEDPTVLVLADTPMNAVQKVKDGWGEKYDFDKNCIVYGKIDGNHRPYISDRAILSATEVIFRDCEIMVGKAQIRKEKLKNIDSK
jgi:hypothetical protein